MTKHKWQCLVVLLLITALLASSCAYFNPGGSDNIHRASAEIKDSSEGALLDYETISHEFERVTYHELGENAAEAEDVEVVWNEQARFISDELAEIILSAETLTSDREIEVSAVEPEPVYNPEELLINVEKKVSYWVVKTDYNNGDPTYILRRANLEDVFEILYVPEQTVYLNKDNVAYVADGVTMLKNNNAKSSSSSFGISTVYASNTDSENEEELVDPEEEHVYEIDRQFLDDQITVSGRFEIHYPQADVRYVTGGLFGGAEDDFDIAFIAGEEFELEITGQIEHSLDKPLKTRLVTYGLDIGDVGQASLGVYLIFDIEGNISFEYIIEQSCYIRAGVRGEKGKFLPKIETVEFYSEIDSSLNVEGEISGELYIRGGLEAGVYFNIWDHDIVKVHALVAIDARAEFKQQLAEPYDRCFLLALSFVFESEGEVMYPSGIEFSGLSWPDIEYEIMEFDIYKNSWLIYEYERCSEGEEEDSFATGQQALSPGDNTLRVDVSGTELTGFVRSQTGHSGLSPYVLAGISPGTRVHLEANQYSGIYSQRYCFDYWHGLVSHNDSWDEFLNSIESSVEFVAEEEDANYYLTAYFIHDPCYKLYVRAPEELEIESPTGHEGTYIYEVDYIPEETEVTLIAPENMPVPELLLHLYEGFEFNYWEIAILSTDEYGYPNYLHLYSQPRVESRTFTFIMDQHILVRPRYTAIPVPPPPSVEDVEPNDIPSASDIFRFYSLSVNSNLPHMDLLRTRAQIVIDSDTRHGGIIDASGGYVKPEIPAGRQVQLEAPEYIGSGDNRYLFHSWAGDAASTERFISFNMDTHKNITVNYVASPEETLEQPSHYTLTVNSSGNDQADVDITSKTGHGGKTNYQITNIASQAKIHLEAPEYLGSGAERKRFSSWSGAVSSSSRSITLEMDSNKIVTANYIDAPAPIARPKTYTLEVISSVDDPSVKIGAYITSKTGHGGTTPYTIIGIEEGTKVHLEVGDLINFDGRFTGWSGSISDEKRSINFTMDSDKKLQANYWYEIF